MRQFSKPFKPALGLLAIGVVGMGLAGCASTSDKVAATYVSPVLYENLSCRQLAEEGQRVSARVAELSGIQDKKATSDAVATAAAIVIFWPAAFLVKGDDQQTAELARLKGEFEAIQKVATKKNCGIRFEQRKQSDS